MKIGIKIWSTNEELFPEVKEAFDKELIDYVEMYYIPGSDPDISLLKDIPMIVHTPHFKHGFNIGKDSSDNMRLFLETKTFVEKVGALYQIIHPGFGGSEENVIAFLKKIRHAYGKEGSKRIMIENMPYKSLEGTACHGHTVEQMERYLKIGPFSFCFDLAHACKASISLRNTLQNICQRFFQTQARFSTSQWMRPRMRKRPTSESLGNRDGAQAFPTLLRRQAHGCGGDTKIK
jgi:deoxyribonuclease-4